MLPIMSSVSVGVALISGAYNIFELGFPLDFDLARNWLSIPFLYIGFLFFQNGFPNRLISVLLIVVGVGAQVFEARFLYGAYKFSAYEHQFLIGTLPFALGMAGLAFNDVKFLQHARLSEWGKNYSLGVYLIHPALIFIVAKLVALFAPKLGAVAVWQVLLPGVVLFLATFLLNLLRRYWAAGFDFLFGAHIKPQSGD
jgi:hypothetical protein